MIKLPSTRSLLPQEYPHGAQPAVLLLPSDSTELVRIDLIDEAGTAYQPSLLCSAAAAKLHLVASRHRTAREVAEWVDYRGIVIEGKNDVLCATTTVYTLRKYVDELLPLLAELRAEPAFPAEEFEVFRRKRVQEIKEAQQKSREVARRGFYESLFGAEHPLGRFALPHDAERLQLDEVRRFYDERYRAAGPAILLSGKVDEALADQAMRLFRPVAVPRPPLSVPSSATVAGSRSWPIEGAVQTTLRIGRVLPMAWHSMDYARFMLLTLALGGYFGSRLMTNLREDKGYTYGVYAHTQIYRGVLVFFIVADVAAGSADAAEQEVRRELLRLQQEPMSEEELRLVKTVMVGDFLRSVDGIFERAERLGGMLQTCVDERLTDNLRTVLDDTFPQQLQELACRYLSPDDLIFCRAGA